MNYQDLIKLSKNECVRGLPNLSGKHEGICEGCQLGKQTKNSHKLTNLISTSKCLELLHMDLIGPIQVAS